MDDQDRLLDEATAVVKEQAFYMKRAVDNDNLREALKHASNVVSELRTSLLSPKNYYELYMQVFQELQHLSAFFSDKSRHNRKMIDLYESVQHAGSILPRLYLLATVGGSYIKSKEAPAKEILKDMGELCKGVQHPLRGLFLRYYLSQMVKDKLPDAGSEYEEAGGGDIHDAFSFLLSNFDESNRLWARMQHQGPAKDKAQRENQRMHLRVLVGSNLVRLSQLDGMTVEFYQQYALPKLLENILAVKDTISQQYLFEALIQVFPDIFHIQTLEQELCAYTKAQPSVDMKPIMTQLMKRLTDYLTSDDAQTEEHALKGVDIFSLFRTHLQSILERVLEPVTGTGSTQSSMPDIGGPLEVQAEFMKFTLSLYPDKIHYVDLILGSTVEILQKYFSRLQDGGASSNQKIAQPGAQKVVDLLACPLKTLSLQVLSMEHYPTLLGYLNYETRKDVGLSMIDTVMEENILLTTNEDLVSFLDFIDPLIKDQDDQPPGVDRSSDFWDEQQKVCRLVHQIQSPDFDVQMQMLQTARQYFGQGGRERIKLTLAPLIVCALGLIPRLAAFLWQRQEGEEDMPAAPTITVKRIFQFVHKTTSVLVNHSPEVAFQLWLQCAAVADGMGQDYEAICYECFIQALLCFEEELSDSRAQYNAIMHFVATMSVSTCLDEENYDNLALKVLQHSARLLKRPMQCRAISICAQVYFGADERYRDEKRVLECLQKCLKICDACVQQDPKQVGLWIEMLDRYVYFAEKGCQAVDSRYVNTLSAMCEEHVTYAEGSADAAEEGAKAKAHLIHSRKYIRFLKNDREMGERFAGVENV